MHDQKVKKIIQQTIRILDFHQSLGLEYYAGTPGIKEFLAAKPEEDEPIYPDSHVAGKPARPSVKIPPVLSPEEGATLEGIRNETMGCTRCGLHSSPNRIVFDNHEANKVNAQYPGQSLFIVGDWPCSEDHRQGTPFCGESGELLTNMLKAINLRRDEVYITNVIKCVPPAGHNPSADEITACLPFLMRQTAIVRPRIICLMGDFAARSLLGTDKGILKFRGRFYNFHGTPLMPTFHPAFLIKYPDMKKGAWNDLQMIQRKLSHLQRMIP
ncbi:MAG: uracil-DNA glycosylase [Thermodesulfobacteriota bacterium]|nr:uracil-DNA glycosylase [Thermodesulfobacteriota bacterium]